LSISNFRSKSYSRSYGVSDSTFNTLSDEISKTIDLVKSLTKNNENNVISHSNSNSYTIDLEQAVTISISKSTSNNTETSHTHTKISWWILCLYY